MKDPAPAEQPGASGTSGMGPAQRWKAAYNAITFASFVNARSKADKWLAHDPHQEDPEETARNDAEMTTAWGSVRSLINAAVSGGVLALAFQIPRAGSAMVSLLMLFSAFMLYETLMLLYKTTLKLRVSSYTGAARQLWGRNYSRGVALSLTLGQFGILIGYANVLRDTLPWVIQFNAEGCVDGDDNCDLPVYLQSWFIIMFMMLFFIAPISLMSNPDVFAKISFTTFLHFGLFLVLVIVGASKYWPSNFTDAAVYTEAEAEESGLPTSDSIFPAEAKAFRFTEDAVLTFAVLAFAMEAHTVGLQILYGTRVSGKDMAEGESLDDAKIRISSRIVAGSFAAVFVYYLVIMLCSYMAFGPKVKDNSLNSFPSGDAFAQVIRCTYTFELGTSIPIYVYAMRRDLTAAVLDVDGGQGDMDAIEAANKWRTVFITLGLLVSSTVLGLLGTLSLILGLTGAVVTSLNVYVFPSMLYYSLAKREGIVGWERTATRPLAVFGVAVSVIALYAQINIIIDEPGSVVAV